LAGTLSARGRPDEALDFVREAVRLRPDDASAHHALGNMLRKVSLFTEAAESYRRAIRLKPTYVHALNSLAWLLATCPETAFRDPREAVRLAARAVELEPNVMSLNTLGVARYRASDWRGAIEALSRSAEQNREMKAFDFFFLAAAHWQLGERVLARSWFEEARRWTDQHLPEDEELGR